MTTLVGRVLCRFIDNLFDFCHFDVWFSFTCFLFLFVLPFKLIVFVVVIKSIESLIYCLSLSSSFVRDKKSQMETKITKIGHMQNERNETRKTRQAIKYGNIKWWICVWIASSFFVIKCRPLTLFVVFIYFVSIQLSSKWEKREKNTRHENHFCRVHIVCWMISATSP